MKFGTNVHMAILLDEFEDGMIGKWLTGGRLETLGNSIGSTQISVWEENLELICM